MRNVSRHPRFKDDRHSVADQPGGVIFFSGLVVAVILGLFIRGLINPSKIRQQVESAASRIHPDLRVSFEEARFSLADGFFPRLAVVITRVRMESNNPCWMAPRLLADEISLPLSLSSWLAGHPPLQTLSAGEVELRLTARRPAVCDNPEAAAALEKKAEENQNSSGPVSVVSIVRRDAKPAFRASGELENLRIRRLTVVSEVEPEGSVDLLDFEFHVRSFQPRVYQLKARTHGLKGESSTELLSVIGIEAEYKEFPERLLDMRFSGHWREGAYTLQGRYLPDTGELRAEADVRHLPLSQLLLLIRRFGGRTVDFIPRQSWLSLKAELIGPLDKIKDSPVNLREIRMEGDLGDLSVERLLIERMHPLKFAPSRVDIRALDLDRLLQFLNRSHPSPVLNKVGRFSGRLDIQDDQNFVLNGEHSGLEFIFANQGQREIQIVNRLQGQVRRERGRWTMRMQSADVERGEFIGEARLEASPDFQDADLRLKTERLVLAPAVQKLMTRDGEIGSMQGQVQTHLRNGMPERLKGNLRWPRWVLDGSTLTDLQMQFDDVAGEIMITPRVDVLEFSRASSGWKLLEPLFPAEILKNGHLVFHAVNGQFRLKDFNKVSWSRVNAQLEKPPGLLSSEGSWSEKGELQGRVQLRIKDRTERWKIDGSRDEPIFVREGAR